MPFVPTEKQRIALNNLIKHFIVEKTEIRAIRFLRMVEPSIGGDVIEVLCLEDEDRYLIFFDGTIESRYKLR